MQTFAILSYLASNCAMPFVVMPPEVFVTEILSVLNTMRSRQRDRQHLDPLFVPGPSQTFSLKQPHFYSITSLTHPNPQHIAHTKWHPAYHSRTTHPTPALTITHSKPEPAHSILRTHPLIFLKKLTNPTDRQPHTPTNNQ
jgi:hypothetical protein